MAYHHAQEHIVACTNAEVHEKTYEAGYAMDEVVDMLMTQMSSTCFVFFSVTSR